MRHYQVLKTLPCANHAGYAAQVAKLPPSPTQERLEEMAREGFCVRRFIAGLEVFEKPGTPERRTFNPATGHWK